jgi:arabinofuranan 3-O-arabinosyltransferase
LGSSRAQRAVPLGLAVAGFVLALVQRPGTAITDTKIDLQVDAVDFLGEVASSWTSTGSLGHIWGSQYVGYLFPQGPCYALGELVGLPPWLVTRLWLGVLLAVGAWGVVRLLDALLTSRRSAAHVVGGALYVLNPYVIVVAPWRSVHLLAYAALPWLLLAVHRGVRDPRGLWWPRSP